MYNPAAFREVREDVLHAFIRAHPLATLVTNGADRPDATHLPVFFDASTGLLRCHMARANPQWKRFESGGRALVIFSGADHYITPNWYPGKLEHGKVVPTWNYVAVHAYGSLRLNDDPQFLREHLEMLTHRHESDRARPWHVTDAPADYIAQQMKAIVRVELPIDRLEGKWKMSQNRVDADIAGVIRGLGASSSPEDQAVAAIVSERRP